MLFVESPLFLKYKSPNTLLSVVWKSDFEQLLNTDDVLGFID